MDIQFRVLIKSHAGMSEPSEPTDGLKKPEPEAGREKISPIRADTVDATVKTKPDGTPEDQRPKDIVEQLREFKEAIKPKVPATDGNLLLENIIFSMEH